MKKIVLIATILAATLSMTSCTNPTKEDAVKVEDYFDMRKVCQNTRADILYDNNTGVMYYQYNLSRYNCGLTPIYNADGTLKIYENWVDKSKN